MIVDDFKYKDIIDMFLKKLARKGSAEEWMEVIKKNIPLKYHDVALSYALEKQNEMSLPTTSIYDYSSNANKLK